MEAQKLIFLTGVNSNLNGEAPAPNSFAEFLLDRKLLSPSQNSSAKKIVCIDYSTSVAYEIKRLGLGPEDCTLVRMEPSVVLPSNFAVSRHSQFGKVITVGGVRSQDSNSLHWPLLWPSASEIKQLHASERAERVVVINGNKMSFIQGELYSLRRKAIKSVGNLDLFGTQWDSNIASRLSIAFKCFAQAVLSRKLPRISGLSLWFQDYPKSQGPVDDKLQTMSRYKYALVLENSAEYMSEKLMEALFAGCIPIYVGPDPGDFGIPRELVIRAQPNLHSIQEALKEAQGWNLSMFHNNLGTFFSSTVGR
jgi:hypothetical protein